MNWYSGLCDVKYDYLDMSSCSQTSMKLYTSNKKLVFESQDRIQLFGTQFLGYSMPCFGF